jgi:hypothetical protein
MDSLGPDWLGMNVPMLWRTRFAASTHPILLRMGPQTLKVPHGTVLVLTIHFERRSSCVVPGSMPSLMDAVSIGSITTLYKHSDSRCNHLHCTLIYSGKHFVTRNNTREPHATDLNTTCRELWQSHCTLIHSGKHTLNTLSHAITFANHMLPTWMTQTAI